MPQDGDEQESIWSITMDKIKHLSSSSRNPCKYEIHGIKCK